MPGKTWLTRCLVLALVLLTSLAPLPASADNTADEADLLFERGVDSYRARRFEDALVAFFGSNRLVKNRNVILNIARCYEQLRRYEEAYRYYNDVLAEEPTAEDRQFVEQSLKRLAPRVALVRVVSEPPGAEVFVERKDLGSRGVAPKTLALKPGKTDIFLSLKGHRDAEHQVILATGRTVEIEVPLEFIYGQVELAGSPEGAEVRVDRADGEPEGRVPGTLQLKPGRRILHVSASGYVPTQVPVEVEGEKSAQVKVALPELPPPTGTLVVTANHEGALVAVDGKESGFTPAVIPMAIGKHRVVVTMTDMRPFEQEVTVEEGARAWVKADLRFGGAKTTAASKTETSIEDAPASITVITREEILAFGYTSLPEVLRGVRGMFLSNDRQYETVGIRGFSPLGDLNSRILVLFDGHPMNDLYAGQAYVGRENNIDLNEVERIEVVRGPVSSLFGSAAFFGVINIVPRHHLGEKSVEGSAAAGSLGLTRLRATAGTDGEALDSLVSLGVLDASGDSTFIIPALAAGGSETLVRDRDGELAVNATARARYKDFLLLGSINSRTKEIPTGAFDTLLDKPGTRIIDQRGFAEARYERAGDAGSALAARAYYDATRYRGRYVYEDGPMVERGSADWVGGEARYRTPKLLGQHLTFGLEYQRQLSIRQKVYLDGGLDDDRAFNVVSAYIADELQVGNWLLVNASARADDYFGSFGLTINPRLAVILKPFRGGVTKLMGGRSFRAPSAYERFYHDGVLDPESGGLAYETQMPSQDLRPEVILTGELEHSQEIGDELKVTAAVFVNRISDLITTKEDPATGLMQFGNAAGNVRTEGAELELRWQPARLSMVSAAYWYQRLVLEGIEDPMEQTRLRSNTPEHAFSVRAMFPIHAPMVVGSVEAIYNSPRAARDDSGQMTDALLFLNAGLSGQLPGGTFRYFAGVQNLLDVRAQLPASLDVPQPTVPTYGRTFLVQLAAAY
ncbi:MAG TPA: ligand-gated channel protein [Myxococcales bacterium]|jgi:outer membrane receptor for ferrienterochelin and colicin|nr:ligand-gated channel protein [Myxococcales bacterium]